MVTNPLAEGHRLNSIARLTKVAARSVKRLQTKVADLSQAFADTQVKALEIDPLQGG